MSDSAVYSHPSGVMDRAALENSVTSAPMTSASRFVTYASRSACSKTIAQFSAKSVASLWTLSMKVSDAARSEMSPHSWAFHSAEKMERMMLLVRPNSLCASMTERPSEARSSSSRRR